MVLHMYVNDQRKFDRIPFNLRYHYPVSKMTHFVSADTLRCEDGDGGKNAI